MLLGVDSFFSLFRFLSSHLPRRVIPQLRSLWCSRHLSAILPASAWTSLFVLTRVWFRSSPLLVKLILFFAFSLELRRRYELAVHVKWSYPGLVLLISGFSCAFCFIAFWGADPFGCLLFLSSHLCFSSLEHYLGFKS